VDVEGSGYNLRNRNTILNGDSGCAGTGIEYDVTNTYFLSRSSPACPKLSPFRARQSSTYGATALP